MKVPWGVVLVAVVFLSIQSWRLRSAQQAAAAAALRADSTAAAVDTSRQLARQALAVLGDSLAGAERRVIQQRQRADQLDRALGRERIALANATIRIRGLEATLASTGPVRDSTVGADSSVRVADFTVRQPPFTVEATAALPPRPFPGSLRLGITLDPVPVQLRLGCGAADAGGIRPASATLLGPPWAALELGRVEQSAELCRSPALARKGPSRLKWAVIGAGLVETGRQLLKALVR